jgi:hypothetical protein
MDFAALPGGKKRPMGEKQALAAIGQGRLIALWDQIFAALKQPIAQVLMTRNDIADVRFPLSFLCVPSPTDPSPSYSVLATSTQRQPSPPFSRLASSQSLTRTTPSQFPKFFTSTSLATTTPFPPSQRACAALTTSS